MRLLSSTDISTVEYIHVQTYQFRIASVFLEDTRAKQWVSVSSAFRQQVEYRAGYILYRTVQPLHTARLSGSCCIWCYICGWPSIWVSVTGDGPWGSWHWPPKHKWASSQKKDLGAQMYPCQPITVLLHATVQMWIGWVLFPGLCLSGSRTKVGTVLHTWLDGSCRLRSLARIPLRMKHQQDSGKRMFPLNWVANTYLTKTETDSQGAMPSGTTCYLVLWHVCRSSSSLFN